MKNARVQQNNIIKLLVFILVSAASAILSVFFRYEQCLLNIMGAIVVVLSIVLLYKNRKCQPLAIMYLFIGYMNYSVVAGVYWNPEIRPNESLYEQIRDQEVYGIGMIMMLGFMLILYIEDTIHPHRLCIQVIEKKENVYLELICTVAFLWIYFTQIDFNTGGRAAGNALSEYRYIAMLFAWSYAPKTKLRRLIWVIIIGTTTIITFAFGNRADAIISAVLLIILWFPKFSFSKLLPFVPAVIILFKMIAGMRNDLRITLEGILKAVQISAGEWYTTDTYTYAYLPGLLTILLKKSSVLSQRINLLVKNIVYIFIGGKYGSYTLANYSRQFYMHYYGFFAPVYFYYWFGVLGIIIPAALIIGHLRLLEKEPSSLGYLIACAFVATVPRWYGYGFMQLPRMDFIIIVAWFVMKIGDKFLKRTIISEHTWQQ